MNIVDSYPISRVALFSSHANGTVRADSDVDFIIEFGSPVTLITIAEITQKLEELLHTNVDIMHVPIKKQRFS